MSAKNVSARVEVIVSPRTRQDEVTWSRESGIRVRVTAPAVDGRANRALVSLLASRLGLPRSAVRIVRGEKARRKLLAIEGVTADEVHARLGA